MFKSLIRMRRTEHMFSVSYIYQHVINYILYMYVCHSIIGWTWFVKYILTGRKARLCINAD